jgi:sugar diacid utilization regulator
MFVSQELTTEELRSRVLAVLQPTVHNVIFNVLALLRTGLSTYFTSNVHTQHLLLALGIHKNYLEAG